MHELKNQQYLIIDYNSSCIIKKHKTMIWKKSEFTDRESAIEEYLKNNCLVVIVYAVQVDFEDSSYFMLESTAKDFIKKMNNLDKKLNIQISQGVYVNKDELLTDEAVEQIFIEYQDRK